VGQAQAIRDLGEGAGGPLGKTVLPGDLCAGAVQPLCLLDAAKLGSRLVVVRAQAVPEPRARVGLRVPLAVADFADYLEL